MKVLLSVGRRAMIWIRADANKEIGAGHVMRCISIAMELKKTYGERVCFLVADENPVPLLEARGLEYKVLHSDYAKPEEEIEPLEAMIKAEQPSVLLVDSYYATDEYLDRLSNCVRVAYLDDLGRKNLPVDLVINYNLYAKEEMYALDGAQEEGQKEGISAGGDRKKTASMKSAKLCLGASYIPLREEFREVAYRVRPEARRVLVTTGGSDKYNLAGKYLRKALEHPVAGGLEYCVVSGAYNEHLQELRALETVHENVHIFCNVSNMVGLMQECDVAITAGGSTIYELAAVGVPLICFSFAENQRRLVETMGTKKYARYAGDYLTCGEELIGRLVEQTASVSEDTIYRITISGVLRELVNGYGALGIAKALMNQ